MDFVDESLLRASFRLAAAARDHGNDPFGAILAGPDRTVLLEAENTIVTEHDCTGHAETNLMRMASRMFDEELLSSCTVYASGEPCVMCAGAMHFGHVRRVVFGLSCASFATLNQCEANPLAVPVAEVYAHAKSPIEVEGPALEDEARLPHLGFWCR
jgi:tRNA(Arg) A34 adenosine deaminase TadA